MALSPNIRIVLAFALGAVAPYLWLEVMFWWSSHFYSPVIHWLWQAFTIKGPWLASFSGAIYSVACAIVLSVALRLIAGRSWLKASVAFCAAFLLSFYVPALFSFDESAQKQTGLILFSLRSVIFLLGCTIAISGVIARYPRPHGA